MKVLVTGAAGMIGARLVRRLAENGGLGGRPVDAVLLTDVFAPAVPAGAPFRAETVVADLADEGVAARLVTGRPDVIFHIAAIPSGGSEADFEAGYRANLDGTRGLFDAVRAIGDGYRPRLVWTSSIAVFGAPFPPAIPDDFAAAPLTSYGTQKAIAELLLADYTRRGFLDGIGIRLPTICVRPGTPSSALSSFFSNIIREPLAGEEAVLPVGDAVRHWHASPRAAIGFLVHAATLDGAAVGPRRSLTMPGVSATVGEQVAALRKVAGEGVVKRIRRAPDPQIAAVVAGWPGNFDPARALALGFRADADFEAIIRTHIADELGGRFAA